MPKYSIGIDYGTLSGRAVLVNLENGEEVAVAVLNYPHKVIDEYLPGSTTRLENDTALQHPNDYLDVLRTTIRQVLKMANVDQKDVIGLGVDFTACTVMPVLKDSTPLCFLDEYKNNPHAYVKLWKHHAAQKEANMLNEAAEKMGEDFLTRYGGKISSEWLFPKLWEILNKAPDVYNKMDRFIEATDWVIWKLTGVETRNSCTAGYKAIWHKQDGYPKKEFFKALDERLENVVDEKLSRDISSIGSSAGELTSEGAELTGLLAGTKIAVANVDAHVAIPAVGITSAGKMLMIMGTSTCHILLGTKEAMVPGMCGVVEDGVLQGFYGYEAGQSCVGDHFEWVVKNCMSEEYINEAKTRNIDLHTLLTEKASKLKIGESGLLALDWWNGNRSVLVDVDLTGVLLGLNLLTKPEEIYRALIEATAYSTKMIVDTFKENGVEISELYAAGGIAEKNPFIMQIYSDVTNMKISISGSPQAPALGAAMFGAVAAGKQNGGFDTIEDCAKVLAKIKDVSYKPIPENVERYQKLYNEFKILHDYFGRGANDVMKRLKEIKKECN